MLHGTSGGKEREGPHGPRGSATLVVLCISGRRVASRVSRLSPADVAERRKTDLFARQSKEYLRCQGYCAVSYGFHLGPAPQKGSQMLVSSLNAEEKFHGNTTSAVRACPIGFSHANIQHQCLPRPVEARRTPRASAGSMFHLQSTGRLSIPRPRSPESIPGQSLASTSRPGEFQTATSALLKLSNRCPARWRSGVAVEDKHDIAGAWLHARDSLGGTCTIRRDEANGRRL